MRRPGRNRTSPQLADLKQAVESEQSALSAGEFWCALDNGLWLRRLPPIRRVDEPAAAAGIGGQAAASDQGHRRSPCCFDGDQLALSLLRLAEDENFVHCSGRLATDFRAATKDIDAVTHGSRAQTVSGGW